MSFLYFDPDIFCVISVVNPVPNFHQTKSSGLSIITCIIFEIELFTVLNCCGESLKTYRSFTTIRVSGSGKLMHYLS